MTTSVMKPLDVRGLAGVGILAMPVGGGLKLIGNLGTFNSIGYGVPQASEAATVTSPGFFLGEWVGSIGPTLLTPFWVLALFIYLMPMANVPRRTLVAGVVCTLLGAGIALAGLGVINYAIPALAHAYQSGDSTAMTIADSFLTWPRGAMMYPAVLAPIGTILLAVVIWRCRALSRTATVLLAVSAVLLAIPVALHAVRLAGGVIQLVIGTWIALTIRHQLQNTSTALPI